MTVARFWRAAPCCTAHAYVTQHLARCWHDVPAAVARLEDGCGGAGAAEVAQALDARRVDGHVAHRRLLVQSHLLRPNAPRRLLIRRGLIHGVRILQGTPWR